MKYKDVSDLLFKELGLKKKDYKKERWLQFLVETDVNNVNLERVPSVASINGMETLMYVIKTIQLFKQIRFCLTKEEAACVLEALKWNEVAKGGTNQDRKNWEEYGLPLDIHNIASAEIYRQYSDCDPIREHVIYSLIYTHGIAGQVLRGEVPPISNYPLYELVLDKIVDKYSLFRMLYALNYCVLGAISLDLWNSTELSLWWDECSLPSKYLFPIKKGNGILMNVVNGKFDDIPFMKRLGMLLPVFQDKSPKTSDGLWHIFDCNRELWYTYAALHDFSYDETLGILKAVDGFLVENANSDEIKHISFQKMAGFLYYDYEGKKKVNVYKKRIIEYLLKNGNDNAHAKFCFNLKNHVLSVGIALTPACEKLVDFCVEAERSGVLEYEKNIAMIFDLFGFRRDIFDRLNNEEKYLSTMNSVENSTKKNILNFISGDVVVDVGSGGGVMLDMIMGDYPNKRVIGTDISENVILELAKKKHQNGEPYEVRVHNFVENTFSDPVPDTIIFSSILHEIFSYTVMNGKKFNMTSVRIALKNAAESLKAGGRIIIRDGVKTDTDNKYNSVIMKFKDPDGLSKLEMFHRDFKGLDDGYSKFQVLNDKSVIIDINYAREFLYTYTWGDESYAHEVQEQFGYATLKEMKNLAKLCGLRVLFAEEYLEPGYEKNLSPKVSLCDGFGNPISFPNSTMFLVLEKTSIPA